MNGGGSFKQKSPVTINWDFSSAYCASLHIFLVYTGLLVVFLQIHIFPSANFHFPFHWIKMWNWKLALLTLLHTFNSGDLAGFKNTGASGFGFQSGTNMKTPMSAAMGGPMLGGRASPMGRNSPMGSTASMGVGSGTWQQSPTHQPTQPQNNAGVLLLLDVV